MKYFFEGCKTLPNENLSLFPLTNTLLVSVISKLEVVWLFEASISRILRSEDDLLISLSNSQEKTTGTNGFIVTVPTGLNEDLMSSGRNVPITTV